MRDPIDGNASVGYTAHERWCAPHRNRDARLGGEERLISVEYAISVASTQGAAFGFFAVLAHHLADERREADLWLPGHWRG